MNTHTLYLYMRTSGQTIMVSCQSEKKNMRRKKSLPACCCSIPIDGAERCVPLLRFVSKSLRTASNPPQEMALVVAFECYC